MGGNSCEFFKVYISQLSSKQLGLPPAFVLQLGGKVPSNCTIKDPSGKIWLVELEVAKVGLVVANGWQEFASHHSLVDGDFLVFDYDGDSQFGVKIYGINGLQKRKAPDVRASGSPVKQETRDEVEVPSRSLPTRSRPERLRPDRGYKMRNLGMPPLRFSTIPGGRSTRARSKSKASPTTSAIKKRQQGVKAPSSSLPTRSRPGLRPDKGYTMRNSETPCPGGESTGANSKSKVRLIKKETQQGVEAPSSSSLLTRPRPPGLRANRAYKMQNSQMALKRFSTSPVGARSKSKVNPTSEPADVTSKDSATKHEECISANLMVFDPPKNPHFATRITQSTKHHLYVPRSKVDALKIEPEKKMTLHTGDGKRWIVESVRRGQRHDILLKAGWRQFLMDNNLLYGDWCVFEMVPPEAKRISELLVHIRRNVNRMPSSSERPQEDPKADPGPKLE